MHCPTFLIACPGQFIAAMDAVDAPRARRERLPIHRRSALGLPPERATIWMPAVRRRPQEGA